MDDHVTVIHRNPLRDREALEAQWTNVLFGERLFNVVCNRSYLPIGIGGAEDQIIGDRGEGSDMED